MKDYSIHPASYNIINDYGEIRELKFSFTDWLKRLDVWRSLTC